MQENLNDYARHATDGSVLPKTPARLVLPRPFGPDTL